MVRVSGWWSAPGYDPNPMVTADQAPSSLRRLWRYADRSRPRVALASVYSVANKVLDLAPPLLIGAAIDIVEARENSLIARLGATEPKTQIAVLAALTVLIWVLESLTEYGYRVAWRNIAQSLQHDLRLDAYDRVQSLEMAFFEERDTGELMSVLNDDVNQLERFLNGGANSLLQVATTVVVITGIFFALEPRVAIWAMMPMPFVIWGSVWFQRKLAPRYGAVREEVGALNSDLAGNLGGIATIKSYTSERGEVERIRRRSDAYRLRNRSAIALSSAFAPLIRMVIVTGFTATMVIGGGLAIDGQLAVGSYAVMVFLTQRLLWPLTQLGETFDLYQRAMSSTRRIFGLLDRAPAIEDGAVPLSAPRGDIRFEHVSFAYSNGVPVFDDLCLEFEPGKTTAIVGATGAGKSTIVKLLLRFYEPTAGRITFDGHDIEDLRLVDLRKAVGLVSQDVFLFHGTVRDNVAYGRPGATPEELERAVQLAEAEEFIKRLPEGWDTIVGERGQKLSGGQRQRLSIARAVLKDPPVLVLDEATSSIDNETEAAIQRSLERISVGRTTIVIAHRLSTVRNADRIWVLDMGAVREVGRHDELLAKDGLYSGLWRVQTGERAVERTARTR